MIDPDGPILIDRSPRRRLFLTGPDRARFLHNYVTNDVKKLAPGRGCEAFVTSPQGKTIGYIHILAGEADHLVRADAGGLDLVSPHFAKYGVFDEVEFDDRSGVTGEIHGFGDWFVRVLVSLGASIPPEEHLAHFATSIDALGDVCILRESPFGRPGLTVIGESAIGDRLSAATSARLVRAGSADFEPFDALRIAAGTPEFGRDVTPENLPQEIGRDAAAISFVKGCYLGQETVARLDALGHVNKILKGLKIRGEGARPGDRLAQEGTNAGVITSVARPGAGADSLALAMVRVKLAQPGTTLTWEGDDGRSGEAIVSDLPIA